MIISLKILKGVAMLELDLRTYADKTYRLHDLQPKASVPLQERCWLVQSGTVEINLLDGEGMLCFVGLATAGMAILGLPSICYEIEALQPSRLLSFSPAEVEQSSHLLRLLWEGQQYRQYYSDLLLRASHYPTALEQLHEVLVVLAQLLGIRTPAGVRLPLRLTHARLSHYTGISRVTVTRLLKELLQQQRLSWQRDRHLTLPASCVPSPPILPCSIALAPKGQH